MSNGASSSSRLPRRLFSTGTTLVASIVVCTLISIIYSHGTLRGLSNQTTFVFKPSSSEELGESSKERPLSEKDAPQTTAKEDGTKGIVPKPIGEAKEIVLENLEDEDFELSDIGFLSKPMTIEEVRLCDKEMQPYLKGSMYYCKDPTCLTCNVHDQKRKQKIIDVLRSKEKLEAREALIRRHFEPNTSVTVMTVNTGQIHLFLNWVCSCEANGVTVRDSTLMIPTDDKAAEVIKKNKFVMLGLDWIRELGFMIDSRYEGANSAGWNPHIQGHSDINSVTVIVANDLVRMGYRLLLHDVDIVWRTDPRPWLQKAAIHRDCLTMLAPRWDALGVANSGFVWMESNRRTRIFMQTLENLLPVKGISDQQLWNALLRHYKFRQISFRVLPRKQFQLLYDDTLRKWNQLESYSLVVHGVSHRKTYRLSKAGLWFFNETCSAWDSSLNPCNGAYLKDDCNI